MTKQLLVKISVISSDSWTQQYQKSLWPADPDGLERPAWKAESHLHDTRREDASLPLSAASFAEAGTTWNVCTKFCREPFDCGGRVTARVRCFVSRMTQKPLSRFAPNSVEGRDQDQGRAHWILGRIQIIYYKFEFFPLKSGVHGLILFLLEVCSLLSVFSSLIHCQTLHLRHEIPKNNHFTSVHTVKYNTNIYKYII